MKNKYLLFLLLQICTFGFSQSVCDPNGISTNPGSAINPIEPDYINYFNWATDNEYYTINSQCTPNSYTINPFQSNQLELLTLSLSKDMRPEDGWEMIAYNLGFDNNNGPLPARPEHTYVMLYNKYTGMLRVLVKWCRNVNYNGALISLKFAPGFQTNLLDMANDEKALNTEHIKDPSLSTAIKFYNDNNSWGYADFKLNYDPCTCTFDETSRLALYTELISNSSVKLTGSITGEISSISQGQGSTSSDGKFWKSAKNVNNKMMSVHKGVSSFAKDYGKVYKNLDDAGVTIGAINKIGSFLNDNAFMKAGLKAIPYVSEGVKFLSGLLGGGASGSQPIQLSPMSVNLDVKIEGTISTQDPMHNETIGLPGSTKSAVLPGTAGGQPLYDETLGVFALINSPVMYYNDEVTTKIYVNRERKRGGYNSPDEYYEIETEYQFRHRSYKLSKETLKYAINPASGLILQDAEVMLIAEYEKPGLSFYKDYTTQVVNIDIDQNNGLNIPDTNKGPVLDLEKFTFQNAFKPIGINNYKNDYSFRFLHSIDLINGKKTRLKYNQYESMSKRFSCYSGNRFSCESTPIVRRPFSYIQRNTDTPFSPVFNRFSIFDFKTGHMIGHQYPYGSEPREEFLKPRVKKFKLKFVLNLKRVDNPDAQNVLYVVTYPVALKEATEFQSLNGSSYNTDAVTYKSQPEFNPANPTNKIIAATRSDLRSFCQSSVYKTNRSDRLESDTESPITGGGIILPNDLRIDPIVYPIPAQNTLNIVKNNHIPISIVNAYGLVVKNLMTKGIQSITKATYDISDLKNGLYFINFKNQKNKYKSIKFNIAK